MAASPKQEIGPGAKGCLVILGLMVISVAVVFVCTSVTPTTPATSPAAEKPWQERCFSAWDGSVRSVVDQAKTQLLAPDTFEHQETRYTNLRDDGTFRVRMQFTAKNAFGVPLPHTATGSVDPTTCRASGVVIAG